MSKRGQSIALGVLAVVVAAVVVASYINYQAKIEAAQGQPDTAAVVEPQSAPERQPEPAQRIKGNPPHALIVGDSYAAGVGATTPEQGYAQTLAHDLGWEADIESASGGGYGKAGVDGVSVVDLLKRADLASYDVIVVQSGYNDVSEQDDDVAAAVEKAATMLHREAPKVPVVVVGEFWPGKPSPSSEARAETIAAGWTNRIGVLFLDPIAGGWSDFNTTDDRHPDDAGHALIARKVEAGMRRAGLL